MRIFLDTWGWVALGDRKESRHRQVVECYERGKKLAGGVWTSNFVLDETLTLIFRRTPFVEAFSFSRSLLQAPFIRIEPVTEARFRKAFELRERFSDKPRISFTDLTSMAIMSELRITDIVTADTHFTQVGLGFRCVPV